MMKAMEYGRSIMNVPLLYYPCKEKCKYLFFAAIHGEEPETTFLLSRCIRAFDENFKSIAVVLCANPDGVLLGTRGNANGVDLNRNFKTDNWDSASVWSRSVLESSRDTELSPGNEPNSEPETKALVSLIEKLKPNAVVAMHAPIGCVDAPQRTNLVAQLQNAFGLPWMPDIGYKTPGSFGSWCQERQLECVTLELPRLAPELLFERYGESFVELLKDLDK